MKMPSNIVVALSLSLIVTTAWSDETVSGNVSFVGTYGEYKEANANRYHAQFRIRLSNSTCGSDTTPRERWLHVRSGRMDGIFAHNAANFRNAYNSAMTALLADLKVQIDGVPSCDASKSQTIDLWGGRIGVYR